MWKDGDAARTVGDTVTSDLIRRYIKRRAVEQATKKPEHFLSGGCRRPALWTGRVTPDQP